MRQARVPRGEARTAGDDNGRRNSRSACTPDPMTRREPPRPRSARPAMPGREPIRPPGTRELLNELRLPLDVLRWLPQALRLRRRRATHPRHVMLLPGFGASERSMSVLRVYLRRLGHEVVDWGLGRNTGRVGRLLPTLKLRVEQEVQAAGGPIVLVGWSLGGYVARELARDHPEWIRKVVTLGSPVVGGPRFTAVARWYKAQGLDLGRLENDVAQRYARPLRVPVTAVWSRRDGIVAWRACVDRWSPHVRDVEVSETHLGMGFAPAVLTVVADELERD